MFSIFCQGLQMLVLTHSSPHPSIPLVQPDPHSSPLPTLIPSSNFIQQCPSLQPRLVSEPKTCKVQSMTILKISAYQLLPLPPNLYISFIFIIDSPFKSKLSLKIFVGFKLLHALLGQSQMNLQH